MQIKGKNFLVYGVGVSGVSAYNFLLTHGANVTLFAPKGSMPPDGYNVIKSFSQVMKSKYDYVVLSPGVGIIGNKNIKLLKKTGALLISECELGYLFCKGKFIALTGTNGKTTCVSLINHILKSCNFKTFLCGNIGTPITSIANQTDENSVVVCEVSSFMLETISPNFKPDVSLILNITPDHISRHKTFDEYYKTKLNITKFQECGQFLIIPESLENVPTQAHKIIAEQKAYKSNLMGDFNNLNISFVEETCALFGVFLSATALPTELS